MDVDVDKYKFYSQTEFKVQKENMEYFFRMKGIFSLAMSVQEWTFGPLIYQKSSPTVSATGWVRKAIHFPSGTVFWF